MSDYNYNGEEEQNQDDYGYGGGDDYGDQDQCYGDQGYGGEDYGGQDHSAQDYGQEDGGQDYDYEDPPEEDQDPPENEDEQEEEQHDDNNDVTEEHDEEEKEEQDNQEEENDGPEEATSAAVTNSAEDTAENHGFGTLVKGALDGFGGGGIDGVIGQIGQLVGGEGGQGLTNMFSSGGMEGMLENLIGSAAHRFFNIDPSTGAIIGAIAGNLIFNMGGRHNSLSSIGKVILDNLISGKFRRDIQPFSPPTGNYAGDFTLDFATERQRCLDQKILFEDPQFPAADRSLYYKTPPDGDVVWRRPGEIVNDPQLIVGDKSRFDVKQGALGDCWLLAAIANLTLRDELFYRVVPPDQSFTENYAGIFHFQFWRYGRWVDVVIDDRLPTIDGKLCYMRSNEHNEFWSALLEKAYAKVYGSYESLEGGTTTEALEDFTGGLTEFFDLRKADKATILATMVRGMQMGSLFGCSIDADANVKEAQLQNGLVRGHAYSITSLHTVNGIPLIRLRNPWGNSKEWNGAWSDGSPEWDSVDSETKHSMGVAFANDGEFWMSFDDFLTNYTQMEVCNLSASVMDEISEMTGVDVSATQQHQWEEQFVDGEWSTAKGTAGGCNNNPETYYLNPQFASRFTVPEDTVEQDGKCTVIVAVLQKYRREMAATGQDSLAIGFAVYPCDNQRALDANFFQSTRSIAKTKVFINLREVTCRFRCRPGSYVVVPCTFSPNEDGQFLLRIFANARLQINSTAAPSAPYTY
ncbi:unnamed protein product [Caenorhabditis auriculariae]|uniref:Calpain catalytic domain-containing protein n=1 Tax=Caenorhabditis auriculariae TaxID=2777116 RepID=A0A8S1H7R1_9PELO|nr:unnamed protein product [Caenorhabditis auriculariae]